MRIAILVALAFFCGCLDGGNQETTTTTQPPGQVSVNQSVQAAKSYLMDHQSIVSRNCSMFTYIKSEQRECMGCWMHTFTYFCETPGGSNAEYSADVRVDLMQPKSIDERVVEGVCSVNADCVPEDPLPDTVYACEDMVCTYRTPESQAYRKCKNMGHHVVTRTQPAGNTYLACVFADGSECELKAYYDNRCSNESFNLTECSDYGSQTICTLEYNPVCVVLNESEDAPPRWSTYSNPCIACTSTKNLEKIVGYYVGPCPPTTTTTLRAPNIENAAKEYCETRGFVYKLRKYPDGSEYGVCVFSYKDECNAEDFLHGFCRPLRDY